MGEGLISTEENHELTVERRDLLRHALRRFDKRVREAAILRWYHDMPLREVGRYLNVGESRMSQILTPMREHAAC